VQAKDLKYGVGATQTGNDWPAIAVQVTVATLFSGVLAYVATNPEQLVQAATVSHAYAPALAVPIPPFVQDEPVRVTNPFDKTETFQFPAGTSETEAHLAVAKLLMDRAREREPMWARSGHHGKKRVNHLQPASVTSVPGAGGGLPGDGGGDTAAGSYPAVPPRS
jgi:hypothetical protein